MGKTAKPRDARNEGVSRVLLDGLQKKERLLVVYMVLIRWEIQKLWLENQIVRATLFVELQKTWPVKFSATLFSLFS